MATKKQRRRKEKGKRHEYELVWVDDEGNEVEVEPDEQKPARRSARQSTRSTTPARSPRGTVQPPSWRRTARRSLLFAPLMFVTVMLLGRQYSTAQQISQTVVLLAFFVPFSYFLDSMMWRSHQKRLGKLDGSGRKR